jgi:predicted 3-demethylubiquinone-9 3-methyltransferase (glyoxalase superfamily)
LSWQVIPDELPAALGDPDPAKSQYAMQAMLKRQKIVISELYGS